MSIVWPCELSVDAYIEVGREIKVDRPDCPSCRAPMVFWSGYRRYVREAGRTQAIFIPRLRCRSCALTHALLPSFLLVKRLDVVETIGTVIEVVADRARGVRPAACRLLVPHTTARDFVRRFTARSRELAVMFAACAVELGYDAPLPTGAAACDALRSLRAAAEAAAELPGWALLRIWRFCSAICGGTLLSANTTSPYLILGRRRFMVPVPNDERKGIKDERT